MTEIEFNEYLVSIGGLANGHYTDRPNIMDCGFMSIGEGWYQLVKDCIAELIAIGWNKEICQIKEKFGGLRFYTNEMPEGGFEIISKYEALSIFTCEKCGQPGMMRRGGWIVTLCDEHAKKKR
jgi:hypothetical protein